MNPPEPPLTPDEERMIFLEGIGARGTATIIPDPGVDVVMGNTEIKEYETVEEAEKAGLTKGTRVLIGGKLGTIE